MVLSTSNNLSYVATNFETKREVAAAFMKKLPNRFENVLFVYMQVYLQ